jgi:general secretion pathway protein K
MMTPMAPRQSGSALILALLVVAIVATLASSILWRQELWIADIGMQREKAVLIGLARSGTDWAQAILAEDARTSAIDHLGEAWTQKIPLIPIDEGELGGFLEDQQGRWNLNNLVRNGKADPYQFEIMQRLLESLGLSVELAFALQDWMDGDGETSATAGAEDDFYLLLRSPYRAANAMLSHVDELRLVRGFSPDVIEKLRPFVTALPEFSAINVNTAPREVLAALQQTYSDSDLDAVTSRRERLPFRDLADFRGTLKKSSFDTREGLLTTASQYFQANVAAKYKDSSIELVCMIRRHAGRTEIVWLRYT